MTSAKNTKKYTLYCSYNISSARASHYQKQPDKSGETLNSTHNMLALIHVSVLGGGELGDDILQEGETIRQRAVRQP